MTKAELNKAITNKTNLNLLEVSIITESLFGVIKHEVVRGKKVTFKGFGTFFLQKAFCKKGAVD